MGAIAERLARVREQIAQAAAKSGRRVDDVELVAISKMHDAEKVREAIEAGQTLFGESRVQEARVKIPELPSSMRWHFVGHLQKNKIRHALPLFEMIQSIDSLALAHAWPSVRATRAGAAPPSPRASSTLATTSLIRPSAATTVLATAR